MQWLQSLTVTHFLWNDDFSIGFKFDGGVGSTLYVKGTHNGKELRRTDSLVGSTLYLKGTHNRINRFKVGKIVGSTLYLKGTHNLKECEYFWVQLDLPSI